MPSVRCTDRVRIGKSGAATAILTVMCKTTITRIQISQPGTSLNKTQMGQGSYLPWLCGHAPSFGWQAFHTVAAVF